MPRGPKGEKRPADVIGNAVHVMRIATGEIEDNNPPSKSGRVRSGKAGGQARASNLTAEQRKNIASVATLVLGLRCSWCPETAPMPRILGLHALPPAAKAAASNL